MVKATVIPQLTDVDGETIQRDGSNRLFVSEPDLRLNRDIAENQIDIIELQANAGITPFDHDFLVSDSFSDSNGYKNSVDLSETSAFFTSAKYVAGAVDSAVCISGDAPSQTGFKFKINCDTNFILNSVGLAGRSGSSTNVTLTIKDATETDTLYTQTTNVAGAGGDQQLALTTPHPLAKNTDYVVIISAYTLSYFGSVVSAFSNTTDGITITNMASQPFPSSGSSPEPVAVCSKGGTIQMDLPAFVGTILSTQLIVNSPERETGDNVDYNLIDASANEDSNQELNTNNEITNLVSNPTILQINLTPKLDATANTPSVKTYSLKVWTSE